MLKIISLISFKRLGGIFLIGCVIKIMDDFLDQEIDRLRNRNNLSEKLGPGVLPYSLLLTIFALTLNFREVLALFSASYIIGMIHIRKEKLPTNLTGLQESLIVLVLCIIITSIRETVAAFILILLLQVTDDLLDCKEDARIGRTNFVYILGIIPTIILTVILIVISSYYFPEKLLYFSGSAVLIYAIDASAKSFFGRVD